MESPHALPASLSGEADLRGAPGGSRKFEVGRSAVEGWKSCMKDLDKLEHRAFIQYCMEHYYHEILSENEGISLYLPAKSPSDDAEDGGVPELMQMGPIKDGWVRWKLVPSTVSQEEIAQLEQEWGLCFPPLFRAFLTTYYHFFGVITQGRLPNQSSDCPLSKFKTGWNPAVTRNQYLPFGYDEASGKCHCIDVCSLPDEELCPVVEIDLDDFWSLDTENVTRRQLEKLANPISKNFKTYLTEIFLGLV